MVVWPFCLLDTHKYRIPRLLFWIVAWVGGLGKFAPSVASISFGVIDSGVYLSFPRPSLSRAFLLVLLPLAAADSLDEGPSCVSSTHPSALRRRFVGALLGVFLPGQLDQGSWQLSFSVKFKLMLLRNSSNPINASCDDRHAPFLILREVANAPRKSVDLLATPWTGDISLLRLQTICSWISSIRVCVPLSEGVLLRTSLSSAAPGPMSSESELGGLSLGSSFCPSLCGIAMPAYHGPYVLVIVAAIWVVPRGGPIAVKTRSCGALALQKSGLEDLS
ncbi:hypothetical protein Tco_1005713 [Tanacetum coccineum]|uniref:Secreted protein n=1 Tax=Tanacetum coccineum TaxID=301880 RepID=A0ABQ5FFS4_9ASTR